MKPPRIDTLTGPPVVGEYYLVRTVKAQYFRRVAKWPVMGAKHEDREFFNYGQEHYHVDMRFLGRGLMSSVAASWYSGAVPALFSAPLAIPPLPAPIWERRKCWRQMAEYPYGDRKPIGEIRKAFSGQKCALGVGGFICPHRQFPLGSIAPVDGVITCPLHGLRVDAATGICLEVSP